MISGKIMAEQLEKFLKSPTCQNARVQVKLPQGEFHSPDGYFDISVHYYQSRITYSSSDQNPLESQSKSMRGKSESPSESDPLQFLLLFSASSFRGH